VRSRADADRAASILEGDELVSYLAEADHIKPIDVFASGLNLKALS
jgi:hypothetical protein